MEVKDINDYLDYMQSLYPKYTKSQLKKILTYGFNILFNLVKSGADCKLSDGRFRAEFAKKFYDIECIANHIWENRRARLRMNDKYYKTIYDGYYYFSLDEEQLKKYGKRLEKKPNKVKFKKVVLWKIMEEAFIGPNRKKYYRVAFPTDLGYCVPLEDYTLEDCELIAYRDDDNDIKFIDNGWKPDNYRRCIERCRDQDERKDLDSSGRS